MTTHKMNLICNIQQIQESLGMRRDKIEHIKTYDVPFLEKKRDNLIKIYNKNV